jgi:hypothetical protein
MQQPQQSGQQLRVSIAKLETEKNRGRLGKAL